MTISINNTVPQSSPYGIGIVYCNKFLETCKYLYYEYTWHYHIKNEIELKSLYTRPACWSVSGVNPLLPRPKIIHGKLSFVDFVKIAEALLNGAVHTNEDKDVEKDSEKCKNWQEVVKASIVEPEPESENSSQEESGNENADDDVDSKYTAIEKYNFQILPLAEFESLEELNFDVSEKWISQPCLPPNLKI